MTMRELAKLANVTVSTVSKAFSGAYGVSEETRQHIFSVARQTGCYGKFYKEKCPKPIIAMIFPELRSQYYADFAEQLEMAIIRRGGIALMAVDGFDDDQMNAILEQFSTYLPVDGLIMFRRPGLEQTLPDIPIVFIEEAGASPDTGSVSIDYQSTIDEAIRHLGDLGHRNVAFLGEKNSRQKRRMFLQAAERYGKFEKTWTITAGSRFETAGVEGVHTLLDQTRSCTALFCAYDYIAIGAIKALQNAGYSVPEDVSVIGMDNINTSSYLLFSLTTIEIDTPAICQSAVDLLWSKMGDSQNLPETPLVYSSKLHVRDTTAPVKKSR